MTTTSARRSPPLKPSVVRPLLMLLVSLAALKGVDGLASKSTYYYDHACEVEYGSSSLTFGFPDLDHPAELGECKRSLSYR